MSAASSPSPSPKKAHWKRDRKFINEVVRAGYHNKGHDFLKLVKDESFPALIRYSYKHGPYHPIHVQRYGSPNARQITKAVFEMELNDVMDLSDAKKRARVDEAVRKVFEDIRSGNIPAQVIDCSDDSDGDISSSGGTNGRHPAEINVPEQCKATEQCKAPEAIEQCKVIEQCKAIEQMLERQCAALERERAAFRRMLEHQCHVTGPAQAKRKRDIEVDTSAADHDPGHNVDNTVPSLKRRCIARREKTSVAIVAAVTCAAGVAYQNGAFDEVVPVVSDALGAMCAAAKPLVSSVYTTMYDGVSRVASRAGPMILSLATAERSSPSSY